MLARPAARSVVAPPTPATAIPVRPEDPFRAARALVNEGDLGRALPLLRTAAKQRPDSPELALWLRWVEWVATGRDATGRRSLAAMAAAAVAEDPCLGFAYYVLGWMAKDGDDPKRARALFARAVEHDGSLLDARRQLRLLAK
jgi:hypothetical protein